MVEDDHNQPQFHSAALHLLALSQHIIVIVPVVSALSTLNTPHCHLYTSIRTPRRLHQHDIFSASFKLPGIDHCFKRQTLQLQLVSLVLV